MDFKFARLIISENDEVLHILAITQNLKRAITIGREGYGNIIDLSNKYISRKHAEIVVQDKSELLIRDLGSTGGTYVNKKRIAEQKLNHDDVITFKASNNRYQIVVEYIEPERIKELMLVEQLHQVPEGMDISTDCDTSDITALLKNKDKIIIGRAENSDVRLPQLTITRNHASIKKENNQYIIEDLGSKNGTFVNGKRISQPTTITPDDNINIGTFRFRLTKPAEDIRKDKHNAIIAQNLVRTVDKGRITILNDINFKVPTQEFVAIMGPSGCGKSTLLKALNGDFPATTGKVWIHDVELYDNYDYLKRMIGYVPQDDIVHQELSVEKSLYYAAKLRLSSDVTNEDIAQKINEVLTNLNINDEVIRKRKVGDLSGGQRKRVSIAVELLTDPSILFLDEPTSPLDPETIEDFLVCLKELAAKGTTILMVTHKPNDLFYVDKVIFLSKGGYLTYYGSKENYLDFFDAQNVIEVYSKNRTVEKGIEWANKLKGMYPSSGVVYQPNQELKPQHNESFFKQLYWLTRRYLNIKTNDRTNTAILLAQAPIIAVLVALIFSELELSVLFLMTISAVWFGTNNAAKEIVGELPIYKRERMFNLRIFPYVLSKILVLSFFSILQIMAFVGIVYAFVGTEELAIINYWGYVGIMFYLSFSASLLGLLVSAMVSNTEKVMTVIPIVLIPQIMLAGVISPIPEESVVEAVSYTMLSRWGTQGFAYVQDSIRSYMANPLCPDELIYTTVDAIEFMNLPNTLGLAEQLSTNIWVMSVINILVLFGIFWALRGKTMIGG